MDVEHLQCYKQKKNLFRRYVYFDWIVNSPKISQSQTFERCVVRQWNLPYKSLTNFEACDRFYLTTMLKLQFRMLGKFLGLLCDLLTNFSMVSALGQNFRDLRDFLAIKTGP